MHQIVTNLIDVFDRIDGAASDRNRPKASLGSRQIGRVEHLAITSYHDRP
jgi:hypothetical protein